MTYITPTALKILVWLKKKKKEKKYEEISEHFNITPKKNVGKHLKPLFDAGLAVKKRSAKEPKKFAVVLTTSGFAFKQGDPSEKEEKEDKAIASLGKRKLQEELSDLNRIPEAKDPEIKQKIREKVKQITRAERKEVPRVPKKFQKIKVSAANYEDISTEFLENNPRAVKKILREIFAMGISGSQRPKLKAIYGDWNKVRSNFNELLDML